MLPWSKHLTGRSCRRGSSAVWPRCGAGRTGATPALISPFIHTNLPGPCACCSAGPWRTAPPAAPPPAAPPDSGSGSLYTPWPQLQSLEVDREEELHQPFTAGKQATRSDLYRETNASHIVLYVNVELRSYKANKRCREHSWETHHHPSVDFPPLENYWRNSSVSSCFIVIFETMQQNKWDKIRPGRLIDCID